MPRIPRVEVVGYPYHVVQRGNRNQKVFIQEGDQWKYLNILRTQTILFNVEVWAYCLMPNHVHLIVMPKTKGALTECISETHRSYTCMINFRENWRGHLWQGRFSSFPMDGQYLRAAVRYVERNPVRANMVSQAEDYRWSSAKLHVNHEVDDLITHFPLIDEIKNWRSYLSDTNDDLIHELRKNQSTGRPVGNDEFIKKLESESGLILKKQKPGPKILENVNET